MPDSVHPTDAELRLDGMLILTWSDGKELWYPPDYLRAKCPCAECSEEQRKSGEFERKGFRGVETRGLDEVGNYAFRIGFSDGHELGIYAFARLREFGFAPEDAPAILPRLPDAFDV